MVGGVEGVVVCVNLTRWKTSAIIPKSEISFVIFSLGAVVNHKFHVLFAIEVERKD
jgi:hypothetical protein